MPELELVSTYDPAEVASAMATRQAGLSDAARRLHQAILTRFLDTGGPPDQTWLQRQAEALGLDPRPACAELATADLAHLDEAGRVSVAYPFSGVPRGHRVQLADGPSVCAMCAIDALGIPQMTDRDATITATDPHTGEPVRIEVSAGRWQWTPRSTVVLVAQADTGDAAALCACPHVNFYTSPAHAQAYLANHPELTGKLLLGQDAAIEYAGAVFGALLHPATDNAEHRTTTAP
ncbi:MAG: organomercurial lyase [Streptosporangiaceae bacterium]